MKNPGHSNRLGPYLEESPPPQDYRVLVYDPNSALSVVRTALRERWPDLVEEVEVDDPQTRHNFFSDEVSWGMVKELGIVPDDLDDFFTLSVCPIEEEDTFWVTITAGSGETSESILRALSPFRAYWEVVVTPSEEVLYRTRNVLQEYIGRENPPWSILVSNPECRDKLLRDLASIPVGVEVLFSGELLEERRV